MISPLFEREEAILLIKWLDVNLVDTWAVPAETIKKLKSLVGLWAR